MVRPNDAKSPPGTAQGGSEAEGGSEEQKITRLHAVKHCNLKLL